MRAVPIYGPSMEIKALVFDVFGTVVDWRTGVVREVRRLLPGVDAEALADAWREEYFPSMDRVRRGELPWTTLDELHRASLDELLAEFDVPGVADDVRAELVLAWHRLDPWPDCVEGLTRLKAEYVIATLSNGNVSMLVDMAKHGGLPWDTVLSAELFKHYKRDDEVYDGAAQLLGLPPEKVLMVTAHPKDLAAARGRGMRTAYIYRPDEKGPAAAPTPERIPDSDFSVSSIPELAAELAL